MLDIKFVREHLDEVRQMLKNRCNPLNLDDFEGLDKKRRELVEAKNQAESLIHTTKKSLEEHGDKVDGSTVEATPRNCAPSPKSMNLTGGSTHTPLETENKPSAPRHMQ